MYLPGLEWILDVLQKERYTVLAGCADVNLMIFVLMPTAKNLLPAASS